MNRKKLFWFFLFSVLFTLPLFANVIPAQMQTLAEQILATFRGPFVRTILVIFFIATGIAFAYNKDNESMKKKCIAVFVGIAIVGIGPEIINMIWSAAGGGN